MRATENIGIKSSGDQIDKINQKANELYNKDKMPAHQISQESGRKIIMVMFDYLRKFMQQPYNPIFRLDKVMRLTVRYLHIRNHLRDELKRARKYKYAIAKFNDDSGYIVKHRIKLDKEKENRFREYYDEDEDFKFRANENTLQDDYYPNKEPEYYLNKLEECYKRIRYLWVLKQKFQKVYTKTAKYKRLRILRKMWQEKQAQGKEDQRIDKARLKELKLLDKENEKQLKEHKRNERKEAAANKRAFKETYRNIRDKRTQGRSNKELMNSFKNKEGESINEHYEVITEGYKTKKSIHDK